MATITAVQRADIAEGEEFYIRQAPNYCTTELPLMIAQMSALTVGNTNVGCSVLQFISPLYCFI